MDTNGTPANGQGSVQGIGDLPMHGRWLRTVLIARSRDPTAVDDLLQDVLLAAAKADAEGRAIEELRPWLYRVAVRRALLHRRSLGRRRRHEARIAERDRAGETGESEDPLAWLVARERSELLRQALRELPAKEAELLLLKYTEDWNYEQIAAHLGLTVAAVDGRLHRARERLRSRLRALQLMEVTK